MRRTKKCNKNLPKAFAGAALLGLGVNLAGDIYGEYKENKRQEELQKLQKEEQFRNDATSRLQSNLQNYDLNIPTFALGGQLTQQGNQVPPQEMDKIQGNKHEQNGTNIGNVVEAEKGEVKSGKIIYSDRLKLTLADTKEFGLPKSYKGKTIAQVAELIGKKFELRPNDKLDKEEKERRLDLLFQLQEEKKQAMQAKVDELTGKQQVPQEQQLPPLEELANQSQAQEQPAGIPKLGYGGNFGGIPSYGNIPTEEELLGKSYNVQNSSNLTPEQLAVLQDQLGAKSNTQIPGINATAGLPPMYGPQNQQYYLNQGSTSKSNYPPYNLISKSSSSKTAPATTPAGGTSAGGTSAGGTSAGGTSAGGTSAGGTTGTTSTGTTSTGTTSTGTTSTGTTSNKASGYSRPNGIESNLGNLYNIGRGIYGLTKPEKKFDRIRANYTRASYLDPERALNDSRVAANTSANTLSNNNRGLGNYLSNMIALRSREGMNEAAINQKYDESNVGISNSTNRVNTQIANSTAAQNSQIERYEEQINQQERDVASNQIQFGLTGLSNNYLSRTRDKNLAAAQSIDLSNLGTKDWKLDSYGNQYFVASNGYHYYKNGRIINDKGIVIKQP